ncbi:muts domain V-domain-containing protein [Fomitopsis betulina]|nr:muts domain V-domain-containing protein [Fomitopsis betulina]
MPEDPHYSTSRPATSMSRPQSRPATGRPQTAASSRHESSYVVAVLEGRGVAREVGIVALEKDTGRVSLIQLADSPTYIKTLHQLHLHSPSLILVPDTFLSMSDISLATGGKNPSTTSVLVQCMLEEFDIPVEPVMRRYWNETAGLDFITQLIVEDDERAATIVAASSKYYALSAASALFKHAEARLNLRFAASSLLIRFGQADGTMMIDPETSRNLELVGNMSNKRSSHSLFGLLNHTYTAMGARLLRVSLLAPITIQDSIEARLDAVEELVQNEDRFNDVKNALKGLNKMDFDKLICSLAASDARESGSAKPAAARVAQMLTLRNLVKTMPLLARALSACRSQLLGVIGEMVSDERLANIEILVANNLNEEATMAKGGLGAINARVYAVKANCNRLLDVARETYKENIGDIFTLNRDLSERHNLPLSLVLQDMGFVFALKKSELEGELPKGFVNVTMQKGRWLFSSIELKKRNARMKDALDETLILSDKIIQDLAAEIVASIGALYKASEAVAILDMLWSFAHVSILRPEFTGTIAIKAGRHPILETVQSAGILVPNDVYCSEAASFQIVQGPNTGKSTYLRQIGLMTVIAMCGCFVPAEYGSFKLHDALLTRLSNDDDMEKSLSTFANEMASCAMILGLTTANSLVLMDEVGRGTSPGEGMGVAHAIAEELIRVKSYVFFATHFTELTMSLSHKPSVVNLHLAVQRARQTSANFGLTFQYKIVDGTSDDIKHYGLELARLADLPADVLKEGRRIAEGLQDLHERQQQDSQTNKVAIRRKALLRLRTQLTQAFEHSTLPDDELATYLGRMQQDITQIVRQTL